jgi:acetyl-CoA acetyltransferase
MITNLYLHRYGYNPEDLFYISKKLHYNGSKNPKAHIQKIITEEDYKNSPKFASPLGLYDISPLSDGSASLILSSEIKSEIAIKGMGHGLGSFQDLSMEPSFPASLSAFQKAFTEANVSPKDIGATELHDAFTTFELIGAEDSGLIPRGKALSFVKEGRTDIKGDLPINPSGGLKSRGHPIGASGLAQVVELSKFMMNENKRLGLVHSIGGLATNNFASILELV